MQSMPENNLYEYAVIRVVPRVEREEFLNVGVILYCSSQRFLQTRYVVNKSRLLALCEHLNLETVEIRLRAFRHVCEGPVEGGPIGNLPIASRFRWLTASRSTVVQTSVVHPGLCANAAETLDKLFEKLVL